MIEPTTRCPCGSRLEYASCCRELHLENVSAATALELMRSRYSAFALGLPGYLRDTWDPATCPQDLTLDPRIVWTRLRILEVVSGAEDDPTGQVEFRAHHRIDGQPHVLHERSTFVRRGGAWLYGAGDELP